MADLLEREYSAAGTVADAWAIVKGGQGRLNDYDFEILEDALKAKGEEQAAAIVFAAFQVKIACELEREWAYQAAILIVNAVGSGWQERLA